MPADDRWIGGSLLDEVLFEKGGKNGGYLGGAEGRWQGPPDSSMGAHLLIFDSQRRFYRKCRVW